MPEAPNPSKPFEAALTFEARGLLAEFFRERVEADVFSAQASKNLSSAKEEWTAKHAQGVAKLDDGVAQRISEAVQANDVPDPVNRTPDARNTSPKLGEVSHVKTQNPNNEAQSKDAGLDGPDDGPEPEGPQQVNPGPTPKPIGPKSGPSGGAPTPERTQPTHLKTDTSAPSSPKSPETRLNTGDSPRSQRRITAPKEPDSVTPEIPRPSTHRGGSVGSELPASAPRPRPASRPQPAPKPADETKSVDLVSTQPRPVRRSDVEAPPGANKTQQSRTTPANAPVAPRQASGAGSAKPLKPVAPKTQRRIAELETPETARIELDSTDKVESIEESPQPEVVQPTPNRRGFTLGLR